MRDTLPASQVYVSRQIPAAWELAALLSAHTCIQSTTKSRFPWANPEQPQPVLPGLTGEAASPDLVLRPQRG